MIENSYKSTKSNHRLLMAAGLIGLSIIALAGVLPAFAAHSGAPIDEGNLSQVEALQIIQAHNQPITQVAFSPDGSLVASSSLDNTIKLWDAKTGELVNTLEGHTHWVRSLAFSPDGATLASGSDDRTVKLWDVASGEESNSFKSLIEARVVKVGYSPDGSLLAFGTHKCVVELRSPTTGILRRTIIQSGCPPGGQGGSVEYWGMDFSPDGTLIATGDGRPCCGGGSLQLREIADYIAPNLLRGFDLVVRDISYAPDGETIAMALVGLSDIWLVDAQNGQTQLELDDHTLRVNSVEYSPDGNLLLSSSNDTTVRLWRPSDGTLLLTLPDHRLQVNSAAFSAQGDKLVSGGEDGSLILWGVP